MTGLVDLEAIELAVRSAMHHAGATALPQLLRFPAPDTSQRSLPCASGHHARYRELRPNPVLTVAGKVEVGAPTTCVRTAIRADFPLTSNWTSRIRNSLLACAVWWHPWASRRRSITDAHR